MTEILSAQTVERLWPRDESDTDTATVESLTMLCASHEALRARLAEVEQALRELLDAGDAVDATFETWVGDDEYSIRVGQRDHAEVRARAVLDKGEPTKAARHMAHYRNCGCLDHGAECCDPSCCPVLDKGVQP